MKKLLLSLFISIQTLFSFSQCNELFISEYIEGSSFNKVIEIYNPTTINVPLTGLYDIRVYNNGSATPSFTINLTGTILAGGTYIVCHTSADASILAIADQASGSLSYNGDDAIELYRSFDGTSIDVIGIIGNDPGAEWLLNGASGTINHTLVRKQTIQQPNLVWTGSCELEWDIYPVDDFTHLDAHTMDACGPTPFTTDFTTNNVCFGASASFTSTTSGGDGNYTYGWDFGDGVGTSNSANPSYMYTSAGTYTVTLLVIDGTFATTTATHTIEIYDTPVAATTPNPTSGCAPLTVCYTTNVTGGTLPYTYFWSTGNTVSDPCEVYNATDTTILIVTDMNGCSDTVSNIITIIPQDDASFNYPASTYCINDANPLPTVTGLTGGSFTGTGIASASTGEIDLATAGVGSHSITYTTNGTCPNSSQVAVDVTGIADATITATAPFCEQDAAVNLTAADPGGVWSGVGITDSNNGTFDPATAGVGVHIVSYTISGNCGAIDQEIIQVVGNSNVVIYNNDTSICNDIFGFFLSAEAGGVWSGTSVSDNTNGAGFFSSGALAAGNYYAVYTIAGQCGDKDSVLIYVSQTPTANFVYSINTFPTVDFTNNSIGGIEYFWDFDDGNTSNVSDPSHTYTSNGTFNVCLYVTNADSCVASYCQSVTINGLTINENSSVDFNVYPNPSNGNLSIESNSIVSKISVKNIIGQTVFNKNTNASTVRISLEEINSGFYFIEIETEKGKAIKRIEILK